jgi:hypothetical protein
VADAWLPTAGRMPAKLDGGAMKGGAPRTVWLTSETDPRAVSARSMAQRLNQQERAAHLIWNPGSGEVIQMLPATRAGRLLRGEIGREGRVCVQIVVIGHAESPFTSGPLKGLDSIVSWLDTWGVTRRWPAGPPLPSPQAYDSKRQRRPWARGGHFGCSQVPETTGSEPGDVDIRRITGPDTSMSEIPRPRAVPVTETISDQHARHSSATDATLPSRLPRQSFEPIPEPANG